MVKKRADTLQEKERYSGLVGDGAIRYCMEHYDDYQRSLIEIDPRINRAGKLYRKLVKIHYVDNRVDKK